MLLHTVADNQYAQDAPMERLPMTAQHEQVSVTVDHDALLATCLDLVNSGEVDPDGPFAGLESDSFGWMEWDDIELLASAIADVCNAPNVFGVAGLPPYIAETATLVMGVAANSDVGGGGIEQYAMISWATDARFTPMLTANVMDYKVMRHDLEPSESLDGNTAEEAAAHRLAAYICVRVGALNSDLEQCQQSWRAVFDGYSRAPL